MNLTIKEILDNIPGIILARGRRNANIHGISINSREISENDMFVCIKGNKFDGHKFASNALNNGASAIVLEDKEALVPSGFFTVLKTDDTKIFLLRLAGYILKKQNIKTIMITGSCGKTSTKEYLYTMLSHKYSVLKTIKNFNNEFGIPLSIFKYDESNEIAILEIGMNHPGEIKKIVSYIRPDISVIINVSDVHIEFFESLKEIALAKYEILSNPTLNSIAIINSHYKELIENFPSSFPGSAIFYDYSILDGKIFIPQIEEEYKLDKNYIELAEDFVAALIIARKFGIPASYCQQVLSSPPIIPGRFEIIRKNGMTIINDCYNSSPKTLKSALNRFSAMKGEKILILGDMLELGKHSEAFHREIGDYINKNIHVDKLFTLGELSAIINDELKIDNTRSFHSSDINELIELINSNIEKNSSILIKGSRGMKMERIIEKCFIS